MKVNITVRMFCYPTEDLEKNKEIFKKLGLEPEIQEIPEAFGLPMYIFSAKLSKQRDVVNFFKNLIKYLHFEELANVLREKYDPKSASVYLRIDKQEFFKENRIRFVSHGDVIHVKIKLVNPRDLEKFLEELAKKLQLRTNE
jgi:RNA binding exosome subunit